MCYKTLKAKIPTGGDGSVVRPYKHKRAVYETYGKTGFIKQVGNEICPGSFIDVPVENCEVKK
jgi:hypothetical protein